MEEVTLKKDGVTAREKKFIINYLHEGDMPVSMRTVSKDQSLHISEDVDSYIPNLLLIVDSFLNYGFLPTQVQEQQERRKSSGLFDSIMDSLSQVEVIEDDRDFVQAWESLGKITRFWQYLAQYCAHLSTV